MQHHLRIVTAQGDDGRQYSLYIYTAAARSGTRIPNRSTHVGDVELATSDGQLVRWRARGLYEIVATGVILRSSALDAP